MPSPIPPAHAGAPSFSLQVRVYWEDTDAGGVVYYANYLKFMERGRTEWLRRLGIDQGRLREERGVQFAVVSLEIAYRSPARLDDEITVTTQLQRLGGATIDFTQRIVRGELTLIESDVRVACLRAATLKPCAIPKDLFAQWRDESRGEAR
ncbi:MAG: tol-pal system-associated acyl-CoA thioesterase [Gammaproteobacteria bacterium]|nr:tol-pal system-associated acyl-CoA thioesterase [Gammaproteobacteria bacterium]